MWQEYRSEHKLCSIMENIRQIYNTHTAVQKYVSCNAGYILILTYLVEVKRKLARYRAI